MKWKKSNPQGKLGDVSTKLNFTDTERDTSHWDETDHLSKHPNFDDYMESFDKKIVEFLQKNHFRIKVLKFFLGCIPIFDAKKFAMKKKVDETPPNPRWEFLKSVHFKNINITTSR